MVTSDNDSTRERIVFFDGVCSLCNGFVDFLIQRDKRHLLRYASLQGHTAAERLPLERVSSPGAGGPVFTSVVYLRNGVVLYRSDAVLEILASVGGIWSLAPILKIVPLFIRDSFYQFVASHRYRWFGKRETCRIPNQHERSLFLD